ncbi:hypothetical protein A3F08_01600 [Candidatus Berkelbacteria bacterium RIFCSPHIGHO2_12_FULL_36_9]|uniref:AI-2E family transporter n=1 Tax=Candidatus Berkelbacteria bacterium RIFCSPHIGHO2_12_FULL_36_9 TaxID=1797469 RepID=A0A1F5EKX5_9BACT|nr:MAG: hypothetical protein A3F08_01600 [Candidatus Berkelbacteria bacterium RIFCSPHIGHO2_12_FULL_36_9]
MDGRQKIEISTLSYIKFFGVILGLLFLYLIRDILVLLFVVLILVAALDPMVSWAEERKIPRLLSASVLYFLIIAFIVLTISSIFPPIIDQMTQLANNLPDYFQKLAPYYNSYLSDLTLNWQEIISTTSKQLSNVTSGFYNATLAVFGGLTAAATVLVLSFYLLIDRKTTGQFVVALFPINKKEHLTQIFRKIADKMGSWLRGQIIVSLIMGITTAVILGLMGVPYALTIGLFAAILEIVPVVGPTIVAIMAVLTAFVFGGWVKALIVLIAGIVLQQLEGHLLIPKIMGKVVGLSPTVIIIALLIGGKLAGIPGAILSIPIAAGLSVVFQEWNKTRT